MKKKMKIKEKMGIIIRMKAKKKKIQNQKKKIIMMRAKKKMKIF